MKDRIERLSDILKDYINDLNSKDKLSNYSKGKLKAYKEILILLNII